MQLPENLFLQIHTTSCPAYSSDFQHQQSGAMSQNESNSPGANRPAEEPQQPGHINIKVADNNNNEVFFRIKRTTQLKKLMNAFCETQGKTTQSCRFLFDGQRVNPPDTAHDVGRGTACLRVRWWFAD
jgi:small ubiquitin-related modifier